MNVLFFKLIFILNNLYYCYAVSYLDAEFPKDCLNSDKDDPKEFYDISQLKCSKCSQKSDIQTVSLDGNMLQYYYKHNHILLNNSL